MEKFLGKSIIQVLLVSILFLIPGTSRAWQCGDPVPAGQETYSYYPCSIYFNCCDGWSAYVSIAGSIANDPQLIGYIVDVEKLYCADHKGLAPGECGGGNSSYGGCMGGGYTTGGKPSPKGGPEPKNIKSK